MSCDPYRDALADAAGGAEAVPELVAHLGRCEACRGELDARRRAFALAEAELSSLLASEPSPGLSARIRRAVVADQEPAWWTFRARPVLAVAAALAFALGAAVLWRGVARPSVPEPPSLTRLGPAPRQREDVPFPPATPQLPSAGETRVGAGAAERPESQSVVAPREPPGPDPPPAPSEGPRGPEVLVPVGHEEALLRFAAGLQNRSVAPDSVLVAESSAPLNAPRPLHRVEIEMLSLDSSRGSDL